MVLISKITFSSRLGLFFESKRTNFKYFIKISKGVVIGDFKWREMFHTHNTHTLMYSLSLSLPSLILTSEYFLLICWTTSLMGLPDNKK